MFLDDVGANLKPARDLGMVTILVRDTDTALAELEKVTGVQVTLWVAPGRVSCPFSVLGVQETQQARGGPVQGVRCSPMGRQHAVLEELVSFSAVMSRETML